MASKYALPKIAYLYDGVSASNFRLSDVAAYLAQWFPKMPIEVRPEFVRHHCLGGVSGEDVPEELSQRFARIRVVDPSAKRLREKPFLAEIEYERRRLLSGGGSSGILYDGLEFQRIFCERLPREERAADVVHLVFTNQLLGTWEEGGRYHVRVAVYGIPSLVSTRGIVEGPAKPRDFYLKMSLGISAEAMKEELDGRFIDHDDPRLTDVAKGYAMQAVFYHVTGNPFCTEKKCRLFNAHWQEDLIASQLGNGHEFCREHQRVLEELLCT
ncbi:MAG: hypothetical protein QF662_06725 [Phycisphaerae bacterium]|nr:hypothetical protein [Phycisphaerae bacterium]